MRRPSFAVATLGVVTFRLVNALVPVRVPAKKHVIRAGIRRRSTTTTCGLGSVTDGVDVARKIYQLAGREFDIGKPSILAKVLFDDMRIFHPEANSKALTAAGRVKPRSVSVKTLSAALGVEQDPSKRELLRLVLAWLDAKAVAKRGGFVAVGAGVADMPSWASRLIPDNDSEHSPPKDPSAPPVVIIDGHYIVFRSFHGMPALTMSDGTPVGALVGFCNVVNKLVLEPWADGLEQHRKVVVAFDTGEKNFRHDLSPSYKEARTEAPDDLKPQFAMIQKACKAYGLEMIEGVGYEADDVIASLALEAVTGGSTNVTIVSADKDLAQLVTRKVNMLNVYTGERLGPDEVLAKFLAPPGRLADLLAIAGDKSDSIIGAEGYGPVKAAKVLAKHATLEEAVDEICSAMSKRKEDPALIESTRERVMLARKLVELCTSVPLESRTGAKSLLAVPTFGLEGHSEAGRLLDFMRDFEMEDVARRTSRILGVDDDLSARG